MTVGYTKLTNLEITGDLILGDDMTLGDDATIAGDLTVTTSLTASPGVKIPTTKGIYDAGGDEYVVFTEGTTPVTYVGITSGNTTVAPIIKGAGETNTGLTLAGTGTGKVTIADGATATKKMDFELVGATAAKTMTIVSSQTENRAVTLPNATCELVGIGASQTYSSSSTDGGTSVEPIKVETTMAGVGGVGGRAKFGLTTNVALGAWANALKAETTFGAAGAVTGLGSALCSEMTLSAGTAAGSYAPVEIELNLGTDASTGTATSLIYASVNGDGKGAFDDNGFALYLNGLTAGAGHVFQGAAVAGVASTHALRINIGGTAYFIPLHTSSAFA